MQPDPSAGRAAVLNEVCSAMRLVAPSNERSRRTPMRPETARPTVLAYDSRAGLERSKQLRLVLGAARGAPKCVTWRSPQCADASVPGHNVLPVYDEEFARTCPAMQAFALSTVAKTTGRDPDAERAIHREKIHGQRK